MAIVAVSAVDPSNPAGARPVFPVFLPIAAAA